jgi:hypothetical protein
MSAVRFRPTATLDMAPDEFAAIHRSAVALAARAGFRATSPVLRARLEGRPGIRVKDDRVYPAEERIAAFLAEHRAHAHEPDASLLREVERIVVRARAEAD